MRTLLKKIDVSLTFFENSLIVIILGAMVLLAFLQVLLRNVFETGILWGDIFLRHLVLWVGFLGASLATREEKHISIDILTRVIAKKFVPLVKLLVDAVAIIVSVWLAKAGYVFLKFEIEANTILFKNIPAWYFQLIIPVGFGLIGLRFLLKFIEQILDNPFKYFKTN